jgi:hypothetical protein
MTIETLKLFCGSIGRGLHYPFTVKDHSYATNGRICIRTNSVIEGVLAPADFKLCNYAGRIDQWLSASVKPGGVIAIPDLPSGEGVRCEHCLGTGVCESDCCSKLECYECEGRKERRREIATRLGDAVFNPFYLRLIKSLPNALICPRGDNESAIFIATGVLGLLMPLNQRTKEGDEIFCL